MLANQSLATIADVALPALVVAAPSAFLAENANQNYVLELPFLSWFGHYSALRG